MTLIKLPLIKRLTATTLAAAFALTGFAAAPAQAGGNDLFKVLVGVTGIYIVSEALSGKHHDNRGASRRDGPTYYSAPPRGYAYGHDRRQDNFHRRDAYGHNRADRGRGYHDRFDRRASRHDTYDNRDFGDRFDRRSSREAYFDRDRSRHADRFTQSDRHDDDDRFDRRHR